MNRNLTINETCWICGDRATTREHIVKKALLKKTFGDADKAYLSFEDGRKRILQSVNSEHVKYRKNLCLKCNSARRPQPFDLAYDMFLKVLVENKLKICTLIILIKK